MSRTHGLLDTSVFVAHETGRPVDVEAIPDEVSISVVTLAELQIGVYTARDADARARRMATLDRLADFRVHPLDADAAHEWSRLRYRLREAGRRAPVNDLWIAATALVHGIPVVTQDEDFDVLEDLGGPVVVKV